MSFPPYPAYKASAVQWLGQVPSHWGIDRLKASVASARNGIWGDEADGGLDDIACVRVADFDRQNLSVELNVPTMRKVTQRERLGRVLQKGNLLLEKSGGGDGQPVGCVVLYNDDSDHRPAVCSNFVAKVALSEGMNSSYWRYVHAAAYSIRLTTCSINQTSGIQNLDQTAYFNESAPYPPEAEQDAIARFLDHETAKIDALIHEQERLIELLSEKRKSIVVQAVTKGLNTVAPRKSSDVDWIGETPSHWNIQPLKHVVSFRSGGTPNKARTDYWNGTIPWASAKDLKVEMLSDTIDHITDFALEEGAASLVDPGNVLVVVRGMILARWFPVSVVKTAMAINQDLKALAVREQYHPDYLPWILRASETATLDRLDEAGHGTKALRMDAWGSMRVPVPPISEQKLIADHIVHETTKLDQLLKEVNQAIVLLNERRSTLISAAVTGKIDVRGFAASQQ